MRWPQWLCGVVIWLPAVWGQPGGLLSSRETLELYGRAVQLMESTSVAVPELARAGAPLVENARQAVITLRSTPGQNAGLSYTLLTNLRAYLALADSLPKPFPFPEEPHKQFSELRDGLNRIEAHFRALLDQKEAQLRSPDRDNLRRYTEENAKLGPPQAKRPRVVFLGDSITDGWRLNEYFPDRDFVNRGISGQITGEMLGRMKADVIDLRPAMMLVLAGTNDIARGVPTRTVQNNLTMIADLAEAYKIRPLFGSLLPVSDYHKDQDAQYEQSKRRPPETIQQINAWLVDFCRQRNYVYVDYFSQMADRVGMLKSELSDDGLHPNSLGYRIMAPVALAAIDRALVPAQKPRKRLLGVF